MSSKTDLTAYFKRRATGSAGPAAKRKNPNPEISASTTEHVNRAEIEMAVDEVKVGSSKKFYEKEKFTFQRKISNVILDHDVPSALVLNLDQTPFLMSLWGSIHFHQRGKIMFPLKGLMTKCKLQRLL